MSYPVTKTVKFHLICPNSSADYDFLKGYVHRRWQCDNILAFFRPKENRVKKYGDRRSVKRQYQNWMIKKNASICKKGKRAWLFIFKMLIKITYICLSPPTLQLPSWQRSLEIHSRNFTHVSFCSSFSSHVLSHMVLESIVFSLSRDQPWPAWDSMLILTYLSCKVWSITALACQSGFLMV